MTVDWSNFWALVLGLVLGWWLAYLRHRVDVAEAKAGQTGAPCEKGSCPVSKKRERAAFVRDNISVIVAVVLVAGGLLLTTHENSQRDATRECLRTNLIHLVDVLNARSAITERHNEATNELDNAQVRFLSTVAKPEAPPSVQRKAFLTYVDALNKRRRQAVREAADRAATPAPTEADISQC